MSAPTVPPVRSAPRISICQLALYLVARAGSRLSIIRQQRRPETFRTIRYEDAHRAVRRVVSAGDDWRSVLASERARIAAAAGGTEFEVENRRLSLAALDAFGDHWQGHDLQGFEVIPGNPNAGKQRVSEVVVSVRPELLLRGTDPTGRPMYGAIKLRFSSTRPMPSEGADYVAAMVHWHLERNHPPGSVDRSRCFFLDVCTGTITAAPVAFKKRRKDIEAACREIFIGWETL